MIYEPRLLSEAEPVSETWTKISLGELTPGFLKDIMRWCDLYDSKGAYSIGRWAFYFEEPTDAMVFSLRWVGVK